MDIVNWLIENDDGTLLNEYLNSQDFYWSKGGFKDYRFHRWIDKMYGENSINIPFKDKVVKIW